jgi:dimeric dUTPase (all-alpha-NTP-PPase superfamily)
LSFLAIFASSARNEFVFSLAKLAKDAEKILIQKFLINSNVVLSFLAVFASSARNEFVFSLAKLAKDAEKILIQKFLINSNVVLSFLAVFASSASFARTIYRNLLQMSN